MFDSENGDFDIQKKHINGKGEYVITAGLTDNGILGKTDIKAKIFDKDTITIDMFGYAFFRQFKYKIVTHARVFSLIPKIKFNKNIGLVITSALGFLPPLFSYENMCSWNKIKNFNIQLPTKDNQIDFNFIEEFVAELEAGRLAELEAYLTVTGLKDYELTKAEKEALEKFNNLIWTEKNITHIFDIKNTKNILSNDIVLNSGKTPYLCASTENNSISSYIEYKEELKDKGNCIFIGGKTFVISYQKSDFYSNDSHNLALYFKNTNIKKQEIYLFLCTCIQKSLKHKYSWGNSVSNSKIQNDKITILLNNEKLDYTYMSTLIQAIQKLVIKDVVTYTDNKINATKNIIKGENIE